MKRYLSSIVLLIILLMPAALTVISSVQIASAAGNVTINDFSSNITKGTVPLDTRLTADVTGNVTKWLWVFHNIGFNRSSYSSANGTTKHTFGRTAIYGVFNVTLVVSGPDGNASLKKVAYITSNKNVSGLPVAAFSASSASGDAPLEVTFTDNSTGATSQTWYFGTRDSSTEKNPTYSFLEPGNYNVVLVVNNTNGWDTATQVMAVQGEQQEKVLPIADFDSGSAGGFTVQFIDLSENANGWYWEFGDGNTSIEHSPVHTYSLAGNYNVNLIVSNEDGIDSKATAINVLNESESDGSDNGGNSHRSRGSSHSSGGSSHSSGGVGASPEPQRNVEIKELSQVFITSGNPAKFDFPQKATPIMNISFDSKKTVGKTTAIAEVLKNQSTLVSEPPSDEVYKFINIWIGSNGYATPSNIENAVVCFKVEKAWLQDKNIDKSSLTLNRFNDTKWNELPTTLLREDDKYLYFKAESPGFSPFAITGKVTGNEAVNVTQSELQSEPNIGSLEQNDASNSTNVEQTQSPRISGNGSTKTPGFEAVCGIISLLAVFLYKRR
jgi:PGF-pre-PGF domain-containing protein